MQRYKLFRDSMIEGTPNGDYCLYSDARAEINKAVEANNTAVFECVKAHSALSASEKRVKELEAAAEWLVTAPHWVSCNSVVFGEPCDCGLDAARKLLEAPHELEPIRAKEPETFEPSNEGSFLDLGGFF